MIYNNMILLATNGKKGKGGERNHRCENIPYMKSIFQTCSKNVLYQITT